MRQRRGILRRWDSAGFVIAQVREPPTLAPDPCSSKVAASAGTSTFVGVTIVAAITTISEAVLRVIRLVTYLRDPFRGLRRLHKPLLGHTAMYRIPTTGSPTRDLPQGADPRAWSWRAARPRT